MGTFLLVVWVFLNVCPEAAAINLFLESKQVHRDGGKPEAVEMLGEVGDICGEGILVDRGHLGQRRRGILARLRALSSKTFTQPASPAEK